MIPGTTSPSTRRSESAATAQQPLGMSSPGLKDLELPINVLGERVAFQVGTNQAGAWFKVQRFAPSVRVDPWEPVRGGNRGPRASELWCSAVDNR